MQLNVDVNIAAKLELTADELAALHGMVNKGEPHDATPVHSRLSQALYDTKVQLEERGLWVEPTHPDSQQEGN